MRHPFEPPDVSPLARCHLAEVVDVSRVGDSGKLSVRLLTYDGVTAHDAPIEARLVVPFAGDGRGAFLVPDVGDEVLVEFVNADPRQAVVVGALWSGRRRVPDALGGDASRVDRWSLQGRFGTRIAIVERERAKCTIELRTAGGVRATLTDENGGKIELEAAGSTLRIDSEGISLTTGNRVGIDASQVEASAGQVNISSAVSQIAGLTLCDFVQTGTAVASTYTPGAGNVL
jgi:uncharacterized protein involved in type VI secretion and phage assembly